MNTLYVLVLIVNDQVLELKELFKADITNKKRKKKHVKQKKSETKKTIRKSKWLDSAH